MSFIGIVLGFTVVVTILNFYLITLIYKKLSGVVGDFKSRISDMDMNSKISTMFSRGNPMKNVDELAGMLFRNVKKHFGFRARSYSELIEEVKATQKMKDEMKEPLIDFFDEIIHISYRTDVLSEEDEEDFKRKIKIIITRLKDY